ncbi:MAG: glutamine synthetase family protein [Actinomycetota bacterium]
MTPDEAVAACRGAGVRLVRFLYCDNGGIVRAKAAHVERLADRMRTGIGITVAMQAMSSLDQLQPVEGMGPVGEVRLVPDPTTLRILPYAPHSAAMLVDHVRLDGEPYEADPRSFLKRMATALAERDMVMRCAVENEFSLATRTEDGFVPIDDSLCFSTIGMTASQEVINAIVAALEAQSIQLEQYYAELGHGQQELSIVHLPVLQAADTQILVRETIRAVASSFGLVASLAPKPWPDQAGNGAHIHFSVWDSAGERNRFHDAGGRYALSETAERFAGGILAHTPALLALTAPSFNSYRRLLPQHWSSAFVCWGPDNREATVRVPSTFWGLEEPSTNLEYKPADASCNPYLAFAGLIAAGLDGLERGLELPDPMLIDPATLLVAERERAGAERYPETLGAALDELERDEVLPAAMGQALTASYVAVRRSEFEAYGAMDEASQYRGHFAKY